MCVYGVVLINILVLQLGPPKQKFLAPPLGGMGLVIKKLIHPYSLTHKDYKKEKDETF